MLDTSSTIKVEMSYLNVTNNDWEKNPLVIFDDQYFLLEYLLKTPNTVHWTWNIYLYPILKPEIQEKLHILESRGSSIATANTGFIFSRHNEKLAEKFRMALQNMENFINNIAVRNRVRKRQLKFPKLKGKYRIIEILDLREILIACCCCYSIDYLCSFSKF